MGSGAQRSVRGSVFGTGADLEVHTVGFRPGHVRVWQIENSAKAQGEWVEGMADDSMAKVVAAADFVTTNGITPLADGFALGADTDINVSGKKIVWEASE